MRPIISVAATTGLLEVICNAGADPDQLLSRLGLDRAVLSKKLVEDTRRRFALSYLKNRRNTLTDTEIAFLLGYSEASAFTRAFRR